MYATYFCHMPTYVALLRGINVSGQKPVLMAQLRTAMVTLGFTNVRTYLQSGNIVLDTAKTSPNLVAGAVKESIKKNWGYDVPVIALEAREIKAVAKSNPFVKRNEELAKLYVTFLAGRPSTSRIRDLAARIPQPEELLIKGTTAYFFLPNGYGKTKFNNNFIEAKLKVQATTRNWKTVLALAEMASS